MLCHLGLFEGGRNTAWELSSILCLKSQAYIDKKILPSKTSNIDSRSQTVILTQRSSVSSSSLSPKSLLQRSHYLQPSFLSTPHHTIRLPTRTPTMADLTPDQRFSLITSNLAEILNPEIIQDVLFTHKRPLKIYWGTAITGRPHCAYFVPMLKIAQFLRAGCEVKLLLADLHGLLDADKSEEAVLEKRTQYYRFVVENMLKAIGVNLDKLQFVQGRSYQLKEDYQMDVCRMFNKVTVHDAMKAGSEVVKQEEHALMSGPVYPIWQVLDEQYLGVDCQFGGSDQRKIFTFAKESLPKIGYKQRAHLMNKMVPGLAGGKMSASEPESKIDVLDAPEVVTKKIKKAIGVPKQVEGNGLLAFAEHVLLPASELREAEAKFVVERERDGKEPLVYGNIEDMHSDYENDVLTPQLLKQAVTKSLNELLAPIQMAFNLSPETQELLKEAYPVEGKEKPTKDKKKEKGGKGKNKGDKKLDSKPAQESSPDTNETISNSNANGIPIRGGTS